MTEDYKTARARALQVMHNHLDLFTQQPGLTGVVVRPLTNDAGETISQPAIYVEVLKMLDQDTLPLESRIPDHLDGVPVRFERTGPNVLFMADHESRHRPTRAGLYVSSKRTTGEILTGGTLTGLASRDSDSKKVLVTNQHVMAGAMRNLTGNEEMYQALPTDANDRVGNMIHGVSLRPLPLTNRVDAAYCEVIDDGHVSFWMHDDPNHTSRVVVEGTLEPEENMVVKTLGIASDERDVVVRDTGAYKILGGKGFLGVCTYDLQVSDPQGDSGGPVVTEIEPGKFKMVGIVVGGDISLRRGYFLPASNVESQLGITFGKRTPIVHAVADPTPASVGDTVELNGIGTYDPDGGSLRYLWEKMEGPDLVTFRNRERLIASFTVPEGGYGPMKFRLTATETEYDVKEHTLVVVNRNPVAKIAEVANAGYLEEVTLDGRQSVDYARATEQDIAQLTYLWQQVFDSDPEEAQTPKVTLTGANTASASFTTPAENHRLKFKLTVTDRNNLSHSAEVIINVENKPPVADAGEDAYVEVSTAAPLDGSGSSDEDHQLDELSFNWQAPAESGVTILNSDHMETSFLAPSTAGDIEFTLTVTDPHEASATATVTKMVRVFTWSEWQDVDPLETRVSLLNPDEFEKKQFRTSDYGTTQYQWVPYSAPPPNGGQQDPPSGEDTSNGDTSGDTSGGDTSG